MLKGVMILVQVVICHGDTLLCLWKGLGRFAILVAMRFSIITSNTSRLNVVKEEKILRG